MNSLLLTDGYKTSHEKMYPENTTLVFSNFTPRSDKHANIQYQKFEDYFDDNGENLKVKTLEGTSYDITTSDVIIRGVKGEYYPCKKDIFEETYEITN